MKFPTIAAAICSLTVVSAETDYAGDIEFLLGEFEEKAGHFFEQKEIDWKMVSEWARAEVGEVTSRADHLRLCARLVARVKDGHAGIRGAEIEWPEAADGKEWCFPKMRMLLSGDTALVASVDPDLGIPLGSEVVEIDGAPVLEWIGTMADKWSDRRGYSTRRHAMYQAAAYGLGGYEGTERQVVAILPEGTRIARKIRCDLAGSSQVRPDLKAQLEEIHWLGKQRKVGWAKTVSGNGYIRLLKIPGDLPELLDKILMSLGDVPGIVLDMRGNSGGGCDHRAVFSRFLKKGAHWGSYEGAGKKPFPGPLVVIVDAGTLSAGETVSGMFSEDQRALMIGTSRTAGMSSSKEQVEVPSGLFKVRFSVRSNKQRFNRGRGIEGIGVAPHEIVLMKAEDLAAGRDTLVAHAEERLKKGSWPDFIDYVVPERASAPR